MNPLGAAFVLVCLAYSHAQLQTPGTGGAGGSLPSNSTSSPSQTPSSVPATNPAQGLLESLLSGAMSGAGPLGQTILTNSLPASPTTTTNNNMMQQLFTNPLMSLGMTGFDNMYRAMMSPYIARFGNNAAFHFLRGGFDKMSTVMMSDMFGRMLAQSTGMNPMMTSLLSGQMFDAPDSYAMTNMLFNGMGGQQPPRISSGLPNGAAAASSAQSSNMFSNPLLFMLPNLW